MAKEPKPPALHDPLDGILGYQLRRASLATTPAMCRSLGALGLRLAEAAAVRFVGANPGCNQGEISRSLSMKRTNIVPIIASLADAGLIRRAALNGRTHALHLTDEGWAIHRKITDLTLEHEVHFFGDLAEEAKTLLLGTLRSIRAKAGDG